MSATTPATVAITQTVQTPDGPFTIISRDDGAVLASGWTTDTDALIARISPAVRPTDASPAETTAADAVLAYYAGDMHAIDAVPVAQSGGEFRVRAWQVLRRIQPGSPLTYTEFAAEAGNPAAVRAAASACATNAPALFVPCHRVLRSDGSLGGFAWGLDVKQSLLNREAGRPQNQPLS